MKILQILPALNTGGVERSVVDLAAFLARRGDESLVLSNGGAMVPALEAAGVRHLALPVHRKRPGSLFQVRPLRRLLAAERPDILHLHSRVPAWIAWLAWRGLPEAARPRLVTTVHGFYSPGLYSSVMTRGERIISVSGSVECYIRENYPAVDPARIATIYGGIDPARFPVGLRPSAAWTENWTRQHPEAQGRKLVTLPGRLTRLKGHRDFIQIIGLLKEKGLPVQGVIAGGATPERAAYERQLRADVAAAGLADRITFTGATDGLRDIMAASSVVLSLTAKPEAFGLTTLEALSLGVPVVGYDRGGVAEQLDLLLPAGKVPPGDCRAAADRVAEFLARPPAVRADHPYTLDRSHAATRELYQDLLTRAPSTAPTG